MTLKTIWKTWVLKGWRKIAKDKYAYKLILKKARVPDVP
jgi:hypothetical protein